MHQNIVAETTIRHLMRKGDYLLSTVWTHLISADRSCVLSADQWTNSKPNAAEYATLCLLANVFEYLGIWTLETNYRDKNPRKKILFSPDETGKSPRNFPWIAHFVLLSSHPYLQSRLWQSIPMSVYSEQPRQLIPTRFKWCPTLHLQRVWRRVVPGCLRSLAEIKICIGMKPNFNISYLRSKNIHCLLRQRNVYNRDLNIKLTR